MLATKATHSCFVWGFLVDLGSVGVAEWLTLPTSDHKVLGLNPAIDGNHLMTVWSFIVQSF